MERSLEMLASLQRLLPFFSPYWLRAVEAGVCMLFTTILASPMPVLTIYIIDRVIANGQIHALNVICATLILTTLLGLGLGFLHRYLLLVFSRRVFFNMELKLFRSVLEAPVSFLLNRGPGYFSTRISDDVRQLNTLMAGTYIEGLSSLSLIAIALVIMFSLNSTLTSVILLVLPAFVWTNIRFGRRIQKYSAATQERKSQTNSMRIESLDSALAAKVFGGTRKEVLRLSGYLRREAESRLQRDATMVSAQLLQIFLYSISGLAVLWYGAYSIMEGLLTLGQFMAFHTLVAYVYGPVNQLSVLYVSFRQGIGILKRVVEMMETPLEKKVPQNKYRIRKGKVVYENIYFSYDKGLPVLNGIDLTLEPSQVTAVVGKIGSGKTTLAHLLVRFYEPTSGELRIDGVNANSYNLDHLRGVVGWVGQDASFFTGSIRENVAYGTSNATYHAIEQTLEEMDCMEFIQHFPAGIDTRIGSGGVQLSGGQKQCLALARAIIRNPQILILDEATSSLDSNTEQTVLRILKRATRDRTTLLIAHQSTSLVLADIIHVLSGGKIVEAGTYNELINQNGPFANFHQPYI